MSRQREHDARRIVAGWKRMPLWLDPETREELKGLRAAGIESDSAAVVFAIRYANRNNVCGKP